MQGEGGRSCVEQWWGDSKGAATQSTCLWAGGGGVGLGAGAGGGRFVGRGCGGVGL